jgi:SAM-dependent methyltransferase
MSTSFRFPYLRILAEGFMLSARPLTGVKDLDGFSSFCSKWVKRDQQKAVTIDLGCGPNPRNPFNVSEVLGCDLYEDCSRGIHKCNLGFESLPFDSNSIDYVTAFDLIEHIPRHAGTRDTPFIFLMNEVFRVLKPEGVFFSVTPCYPFKAAFQDPTHNNIITVDTFPKYFSISKFSIASHYGITAKFEVCEQRVWGSHLVAVLTK